MPFDLYGLHIGARLMTLETSIGRKPDGLPEKKLHGKKTNVQCNPPERNSQPVMYVCISMYAGSVHRRRV
jgi:hypothetical protein